MSDIQVLLADDHAVVRSGLRMLLESQPDMRIIGEAENGRQAVAKVRDLHPDVVLMDIEMPDMNGIDATRQIREASPETAVLALTMYEDDQYFFEMLRAGAAGYVPKRAAPDELVTAIRAVSQINRAFRTALAPPLLHRCPSIAELAQHIRSETPVVGTRRFYHASSGTRPIPLCLINFEADFLNDHLADRSVHMAPALFGDSAYNYRTSIADYAADYATDLQLMQFDQPPTLIGFSIGGLVAYEAARQLRDMGHPPGRLILVEPVTPLWQGPVPKRRSTWAAYRLARHYEGKGGMAVRALMAALLTKWNRPVGEALRKAAAMAYISLTVEAESLAPYKGELTLIGTPFFEEIELPLWQRALAQPPRFIRVTGCDHFGLVKPPFSAQWLQHID